MSMACCISFGSCIPLDIGGSDTKYFLYVALDIAFFMFSMNGNNLPSVGIDGGQLLSRTLDFT